AVHAQLAVYPGPQAQRVRIGNLVAGDDPRSDRTVRVEGLSERGRRRTQLPVPHADVVADGVAGNDVQGFSFGHIAAAATDDHRHLAFVIQLSGYGREMNVTVRPVDAGDLFVEPRLV